MFLNKYSLKQFFFSYNIFRICVLQSIPTVEFISKSVSKILVLDTSLYIS